MGTMREKVERMKYDSKIRYILCYDMTAGGGEKLVQKILAKHRGGVDDLAQAVEDAVSLAGSATIHGEKKTKYIAIGVRANFIQEVTVSYKTFGQPEYLSHEEHLVSWLAKLMAKLGIVPVNNYGIQEVDPGTFIQKYLSLPVR